MLKKRVMLIGSFSPGQLMESFAQAFERIGYEVTRFDSDRAYFDAVPGARYRIVRRALRCLLWQRMNLRTIELVASAQPAFVMAAKGTYLHAKTIRRIRSLGIPFVNYYSDNPYCGVPWNPRKSSTQRRDLIQVMREYDRVWIWERGMAKRLRADGVHADYLPFGVDPEISRPVVQEACVECGIHHAVVFIGQHSDKRGAHVAAIKRFPVALWGSRWGRAERIFSGRHQIHQRAAFARACAALYSMAEVSLNIVDDLNMPGHNMRTFEIPASGGLLMSTYTAEQAEFFPEEEAALYYREPGEIDEKIHRVLKDRAWARGIREKATAISASHHYTERVGLIAADLGV